MRADSFRPGGFLVKRSPPLVESRRIEPGCHSSGWHSTCGEPAAVAGKIGASGSVMVVAPALILDECVPSHRPFVFWTDGVQSQIRLTCGTSENHVQLRYSEPRVD